MISRKILSNSYLLIILSSFLFSNLLGTNAGLVTITKFHQIAEKVKSNPNSLTAIMTTRLQQCERCSVGNKVFEEFAVLTDGVVLTYLVDCEKIWENADDQLRIPACDPEKKHELPHITFFRPDVNELDIYNKQNKKMPKDTPYQGMVSPDALLQKSKEYLPNFTKMISNIRELDSYLNNKEIPLKLLLFTDEETAPLYIRALSGQFRGQVDFGIADVDNKKLKKRYNLTKAHALFALKLVGTDYEKVDYDGEYNVAPIAQFLKTHLNHVKGSSSNNKVSQGVYFDIPDTVEVQTIKPSQIHIVLKKYKENFILIHLQKGQNTESSKILESVKKDFKNLFKYYTVQCDAKECEQQYGTSIKQFPAVIIYNLSQQRKIAEFTLVEKYEDKDFLAEQIFKNVNYANLVENEVESNEDAKKKISEGLNNKKHSVVFAHDKYDHYHKLIFYVLTQQNRFRRYLQLIRFVNPTQSDLQNWSINGVPGVVTILEMNEFKQTFRRAPYEYPDYEYNNLVDYLNQQSIQKQEQVVEEIKVEEITKQEDLEEKCLNNKDKACLIALVDLTKEGKFKMDQEKLDKIKKLYADRDYNYFYIDTKCHRELLTLFKLTENALNTLLFLDAKKTKYKVLKGPFEVDNIVKFMDELNGKRPKGLVSLPGSIDLDERDCVAFNASEKQKLEQERTNKRSSKYKKEEL